MWYPLLNVEGAEHTTSMKNKILEASSMSTISLGSRLTFLLQVQNPRLTLKMSAPSSKSQRCQMSSYDNSIDSLQERLPILNCSLSQ